MFTYDVSPYAWHGDPAGASWHNCPKLADVLNTRANEGWRLVQMLPVSIGFLLVFEGLDRG